LGDDPKILTDWFFLRQKRTLPKPKGGSMKDAAFWIEKLDLQPHPEGGHFIETYRSDEVIPKEALPTRFEGDRVFSTSIYFLLDKKDFSAFHIMEQDEIWHFYDGSSLTIHIIDQSGNYSRAKLGRDIQNSESLQIVVKAHSYFAAAVNNLDSYSLVGCTVAPGFEYADWKMPTREKLVDDFPEHKEIIEKFTH
jgi:predicted cupin superfamily sugar epimerase